MIIELTAFAEQNPKKVHPDAWPTCDLYDAYVIKSGTSSSAGLVDLLDVLEKGPFTVKGVIKRIPEELEPFVLKPNVVNHEIQIAQVRRWSIERLPDEKIIIWALGNAAWYGIHPSKEYKPVYQQMLQKAAIYNFIIDKYGRIPIKGQPLTTPMPKIYLQMSKEHSVLGNPANVEDLIEQHRRFIIAQLLESPRYQRTPLWTYMKENHDDEIEEVAAVIKKVEGEIQSNANKKAERLARSPPSVPSPSPKKASKGTNKTTKVPRTRSGTASSGSSDAGTSSKRKSRDQPQEEPESQRRKTDVGDQAGKTAPRIKLAQKSRRSTRIVDSSASSPDPQSPPVFQERVTLAGRATRSGNSPHDPPSPSTSEPRADSALERSPPLPSDTIDEDGAARTPASQLPRPPAEKLPPPPRPSVDTLKGIIKETHKPVVKTNAVPASKLARLPGTRSQKAAATTAVSKKIAKAGPVGIMASSSGILRASTRAQQKIPAPGVVPLDENHPGYDDLRDQAISKLTQLHALYQKISKSDSQADYQKFLELADENAKWRALHKLKPVYIDVIYATGYYTDEIKDSSFIERVPETEYLVDTTEWDFDTAVELLQNVNRGTYIHELLQPVKEARRNAMAKSGKPGRGRPRKHLPQEIESSMSALKISSVPAGVSLKDGEKVDMHWKCLGYDEDGNKCDFEVENAASLEGAKKASDHWRTCTLRQHATEEALERKKATIEEAQTVLRDQQVRDPWTNLDHLVNWIEGEANKSRSWFPAGVC